MNSTVKNQYVPDQVSAPGETLLELLNERHMSQAELAERAGRPTKTINEIIKGKAAITPETALQLELVLGVPAYFWAAREQQYREFLARRREAEELASQIQWLDTVPYREMMKHGWIPKAKDEVRILQSVLRFFGVASTETWREVWGACNARFRKSSAFESSAGAVAAWLRKGELEAQKIRCETFSPVDFKRALSEIRGLTRDLSPNFDERLVQKCSAVGVRVVFVPELPRTCAWGATRWTSPSCALIQLSLRYKTDDHFWFTFFHEAGHILLHGKKNVFLENKENATDKPETEANTFASDWLIPQNVYRSFVKSGSWTNCQNIARFADQIGIAPGIVVGRLQHDRVIEHHRCYYLKKKLEWCS
jgi:HTH-type transcriptional regulator / antitoxin HigA